MLHLIPRTLFIGCAVLSSATCIEKAPTEKPPVEKDVSETAPRPNIILILADDQGYGDTSGHGNPVLKTPNIDRFEREGVSFRDFHVSPSCSPTRAALMSGCHEFKSGVTHTLFQRERLSLQTVTLAQVLKRSGYATAIFGKWHLGDEDAYQPGRRGFDESFIFGGGSIGTHFGRGGGDVPNNSYFDPIIRHNGRFEKTSGYCTDVFFNQAECWIHKVKGKQPFFAYLPTNAAHAPRHARPEDLAQYKSKVPRSLAEFYGMIGNIDDNVGRLMDKLKEWDLERNTLVIYMNDNGGQPDACDVYNAGLKGHKGDAWEGGTKAMSIWRWPGSLKPASPSQLAAHIDVLPTLAELAGATLDNPLKNQVEGRSLVPVLRNPEAPWPDRLLITHAGRWGNMKPGAPPAEYEGCSVRNQHYSLMREEHGWTLYDIKCDPGQKVDIAAAHPDTVKTMVAAYEQWWRGIQPCLINENAYKTAPVNPFAEAYLHQTETDSSHSPSDE